MACRSGQTFTLQDAKLDTEPSEQEMLQFSERLRILHMTIPLNGRVCSNDHVKWRQQQLKEFFMKSGKQLSEEFSQLRELLAKYHDIFSLEDDERGETDLIGFRIDTGDSCPKKQPVRRIPFAAQQEIVEQLEVMQMSGVIEPLKIHGQA